MHSRHKFLAGGGELGALMRGHDWSTSPLGDPADWPHSLRSIVSFMLNSKFPMFVAWGKELGFLYNDAYAEILGIKHPAALGHRFQDIWSEIWNDLTPLIEQALSGAGVFLEDMPLTMRRKGFDEQTWFTFSYSPVRDETSAVQGMGCVCIETTEKVLTDRRSREEYQRLHSLFQQAPGMMAVLRGPDHVFEIANDAYYRFVKRRDVIGKNIREVFPDLAGQVFFDLLDRVYATGERYLGMNVRIVLQPDPEKDTEERFFNFVCEPIRDAANQVTGIFYEGFDVTENMRITAALRESEAKFRTIADAMPQMVWSTLPDGYHDYYNQQWYDFTGAPPGSTDGEGWNDRFHPEDQARAWNTWKHSLETGETYEIHYRLRHHSGQYRWVLGRALPLRNDEGKIVRWMGTCTDVHDQKLTEEELKAVNRRKDEFLAMLAHELRNPLAPISTAAQLLKISATDERRVTHASDIIARQVTHMTKLVDDLLDVSRVTRGLVDLDIEPVDIKLVVASAVEQAQPLIEARNHSLNIRMGSAHTLVNGDRTRLVQILTNILNNAAKYTPQGGEITLSVCVDKTQVEISVSDNGIGIEKDLLPRIFELFTQAERTPDRAQGGLGLGLALVKSITQMHGGGVRAFSEGVGKGTTVSVTLPRLSEPVKTHQRISEGGSPRHSESSLDIMVVDDNIDAADALAELLSAKGHRVIVESDPRVALESAAAHPTKVFILDIGLPGMDGYDLARHLRARAENSNSLFIALTGYGQSHDKVLAKAAGFDHHFVKPMNAEKLNALFAKFTTA
ncbi:MAG: hypothetical protein K0S28_2050 [Paucimonas sp.]|nr:hypothetical protein [Paucimonas sp.]